MYLYTVYGESIDIYVERGVALGINIHIDFERILYIYKCESVGSRKKCTGRHDFI